MADHGTSPELTAQVSTHVTREVPRATSQTASPPNHTVSVTGELDMASVEAFVSRALAEVVGDPATLTIDFAGVEFCDSAGINGLVHIRKRCQEAGWGFRMVSVRPHIRRVLVDLTGLGEFLNIENEASG